MDSTAPAPAGTGNVGEAAPARIGLPLPSRRSVQALACAAAVCALALLAGAGLASVAPVALALVLAATAWAALDLWRSHRAWRAAPLRVRRQLPQALALGTPTPVLLTLDNPGALAWTLALFDEADPRFAFDGLPQTVTVPAGAQLQLRYHVTALQRGPAQFGSVQLRLRSAGGAWDLRRAAGQPQSLRVYPDFAALGRYAWLAGSRQLAQIGIRSHAQRGSGTEFRQLADYRPGDALRHLDWKATLRHRKPLVREFQDERNQCVMLLLDCGRRMRADESQLGQRRLARSGSHFDQALNALLLLGHVALQAGDEVGLLTFGNAAGEERSLAPRKGLASLDALLHQVYDLEPAAVHSDYTAVAMRLARLQHKRALVILVTNFRGEDLPELRAARELLRRRHLVVVASLRERVVEQIAGQPLDTPEAAVEVATAHLFAQERRDAFRRAVGPDALAIDVEPAQLATALVNQYHAVKRAGLL